MQILATRWWISRILFLYCYIWILVAPWTIFIVNKLHSANQFFALLPWLHTALHPPRRAFLFQTHRPHKIKVSLHWVPQLLAPSRLYCHEPLWGIKSGPQHRTLREGNYLHLYSLLLYLETQSKYRKKCKNSNKELDVGKQKQTRYKETTSRWRLRTKVYAGEVKLNTLYTWNETVKIKQEIH